MRPSPDKPIAGLGVLAVTSIAVAAAVLAAAGVGYLLYLRTAELRTRLEASEARVRSLSGELEEAQDALLQSAGQASSSATTAPDGTTDAPAEEPAEAVEQFCFVKDVTESGAGYSLVLDYAQLLTGKAAAEAAAARGEESPPPNDYFIVNDNPKLRTFAAAPGARVTLYYNGLAEKRTVTVAQFAAIIAANKDGKADVPYHALVAENEVLALEEQYLP